MLEEFLWVWWTEKSQWDFHKDVNGTPEEMRNQINECEKYNLKPCPIYDMLTLEIVKIKCHPNN